MLGPDAFELLVLGRFFGLAFAGAARFLVDVLGGTFASRVMRAQ